MNNTTEMTKKETIFNLTPEQKEANRTEMVDYIMHTYGIADDQTALRIYKYISFVGLFRTSKVEVDRFFAGVAIWD